MSASPKSRSLLDGVDLVVFDKDGTLIDFHAMWGTWLVGLAADLARVTGRPVLDDLRRVMDAAASSGRISSGGPLATSTMAVLRGLAVEAVRASGCDAEEAAAAVDAAWSSPDPVALARPLADLTALFGRLRDTGRHVAVVTADDRAPTEATLAALGVAHWIGALVCADDGLAMKPAPDMLLSACDSLGVSPARTAMVGDTPADLAMARAAGALAIGVLSGVGDREALAPLADLLVATVAELPGL